MSFIDIIVVLILIAILILICLATKNKKKGNHCSGCKSDCSSCSSGNFYEDYMRERDRYK